MSPDDPETVDLIADHLPAWLKEKRRPPWIQAAVWNNLPEEDQEQVHTDELAALVAWLITRPVRREWDGDALAETIDLFFSSALRDEGKAAEHSILSPDFGRGVAGEWQQFAADNARAAQYLDLFRILGGGFPRAHFNLCGELATMAILGVGLSDGLKVFRGTPSGADVLADKSAGTTGPQLARFITAASDGGLTAEFKRAVNSNRPEPVFTPDQMVDMFNQGGHMLTLVNIDGFRGIGRLKPVAESVKKIAHWVAPVDVIEPRRGETIIRTYNPFQNQEELYTWTTFAAAWKETEGNFSRYGVVVALPAT